MPSDPAHFLLLVPVAVFLPGLAYRGFGARFPRVAYRAVPRLVTHEMLDPFGERPHIILQQNNNITTGSL